jgi:hypothetical protein
MSIDQNFEFIDTVIADSNLIELWGGHCVNKLDKDVPYGVKVLTSSSTKETNVFSINENVKVSGYSYLFGMSSGKVKGTFDVEIGINIFVNPKKIGRVNALYEVPMALIGKLNKKYPGARIQKLSNERFAFSEMATIIVPFFAYASCENLDLTNNIC